MRLPKEFKLEKVASGNVERITIYQNAYYDHEKHTLTATDGHCLLRVAVTDDESDISGIIPCEAITEARKIAKKFAGCIVVETKKDPAFPDAAGKAHLLDGRSYPLFAGQYPNCDAVIPKPRPLSDNRYVRLELDPTLLWNLYQAAGQDKVNKHKKRTGAVLEFSISESGDAAPDAVIVRMADVTAAVIMPMRLGSRYPERVELRGAPFQVERVLNEEHAKAIAEDIERKSREVR